MTRTPLFVWILTLLAVGCQPDGGGGEAGDGGGAAGEAGPDGGGGVEEDRDIPYEGMVPDLPDGTEVDERDFFPLTTGGVWRYRRQAAMWQDPPPVEQGGEATIAPGENDEVVRTTVTIIDLMVDGEATKVRQLVEETYVLTPAVDRVGPLLKFKSIDITEREVETGRFVRKLERRYLPPYVLVSDSWQVGNFDTNLMGSDTRLIQDLTLRGDEEPTHTEGLINYRVTTGTTPEVLPMEGQYREEVRKIEVYDDFSDQLTRTYWVQMGVGLVQWRFRDTNNITFTLTETNLESPQPPSEGPEPDAGAE